MEAFRSAGIEVLVLTDPVDPFMLMQLNAYQEHPLVNVAEADLPEDAIESLEESETPALDPADLADLIVRFKSLLGERVSAVRTSTRMSASPARLVDPEGAPDQSVQRVYKLMDKDFELPKKVLELNPKHPIMVRLAALRPADPKFDLVAEQIFENTLLVEGLHPDPVSMVGRIQELITSALGDIEAS
jgi:molecular chaperone HtpG